MGRLRKRWDDDCENNFNETDCKNIVRMRDRRKCIKIVHSVDYSNNGNTTYAV